MSGRQILMAAIIALAIVDTGNAQFISSSILDSQFLKNERYKDVKTFDVGFIGATDYPDRERLERKAKEEARRLLVGITYKSAPPRGQDFDQAFVEGSHLGVIVDVKLAWGKDTSRIHTGASVETLFVVNKKNTPVDLRIGEGLPNLERVEIHSVVACHRDRLLSAIEQAIEINLEELSHAFFESR